ncbi:TPA: hypothetical protein DCZ39_03200 [Patescibacteria group bacterium]|nr:hypothetical protein [Candidatus Gracilibacteria bacterium]
MHPPIRLPGKRFLILWIEEKMFDGLFQEDGVLASFADDEIFISCFFERLLDIFTCDICVVEFLYILFVVSDFFKLIS